jgi:hypothetical protein
MIVDQMIVDQKKGNHVYGQNLFWLMWGLANNNDNDANAVFDLLENY